MHYFDGQVCDFRLPVGPDAIPAPVAVGRRKPLRRPRHPVAPEGFSRAWYERALRELRPYILGTPTVLRPAPPAPVRRRAPRPRPPAPWNRLKGSPHES